MLSSDFIAKNKTIMAKKRGAGYWLWKPYVILDTLKNATEGDLVIYIDSGIIIKKPLDLLINQLGDFHMMAFYTSFKNLLYIKNDLFTQMGMDSNYAKQHLHYDAAILVMRNVKQTREFVEKWLKWCEDEHALTDTPSKSNESPEFIDHRHDQAIMSLLLLKEADNIKLLALPMELKQKFFYHHRRREVNKSLVILD